MTNNSGRNFLHTPGPTTVPERVLSAMMRPAIDLMDANLIETTYHCVDDLKRIFKTEGEIFVYACNGHGAWEAALANLFSPGDRLLLPEAGHFSLSWAEMARAMGLAVEAPASDWRRGLDPALVEEYLRQDREQRIKAVLMVHTDTATGVTSDVAAIRRAIDSVGHPALFVVDTIASLATTDFRMDDWGVDVAIGAAQKGLMLPPGLGFVTANAKAMEAHKNARLPRYYWDWERRLAEHYYSFFCGTSPEHLVFALRAGLDMIFEEGLQAVFERHLRLSTAVRRAVAHWGRAGALELHAAEAGAEASSVSTILVGDGFDADALRATCRNSFNVSLGSGLGRFAGRAFRIGHMGHINEPMVLGALGAVEAALMQAGVPHERGGVQAAVGSLAAG